MAAQRIGIVLAAGAGARLGLPVKALAKVAEKSLVRWSIEALEELDVSKVLVVIDPTHEHEFAAALEGVTPGRVTYVAQPAPLGTLDAFQRAWEVRSTVACDAETVIVWPADAVFTGDFKSQVKGFETGPWDVWLPLSFTDRPREMGIIELNHAQDSIVSLEEKPLQPKSNLTFCSVWMMKAPAADKAILRPQRDRKGEYNLTSTLAKLIEDKQVSAGGQLIDFEWLDCGYPEGLAYANKRISALLAARLNGVAAAIQTRLSAMIADTAAGKHINAVIEYVKLKELVETLGLRTWGESLTMYWRDALFSLRDYELTRAHHTVRPELPTVSFDLDGVIAEPFDMTEDEADEGGFVDMAANAAVIDVMRWLHERANIVIVTSRKDQRAKRVEFDTKLWLAEHEVPYDALVFTYDKSRSLAEAGLKPALHIEDSAKHVFDMVGEGIRTIYVTHEKSKIRQLDHENVLVVPIESLPDVLRLEAARLTPKAPDWADRSEKIPATGIK